MVKGWFRTSRSPTKSVPDLHVVAMTALEIASAMECLHDKNVTHGVSPVYQWLGFSDVNNSVCYCCDIPTCCWFDFKLLLSHPDMHLCCCLQDLTGGNIMLSSSSFNPHGFTAKVGDFGLARDLSPGTRLKDNNYGTVTHMPPEVLLDGHISQVSHGFVT